MAAHVTGRMPAQARALPGVYPQAVCEPLSAHRTPARDYWLP